jgi:hypothetical protein
MPFTPFHFGPGAVVHSAAPKHISFLAFCGANVLVDVDPKRTSFLYSNAARFFRLGKANRATTQCTLVEGTDMTAARCVALTICALGIAPALAAPVPLGDPFYVRYGESVELVHGVRLKFVDVRDERCPADLFCLWQGEAFVEIELQAEGQTARGSMTTEKADLSLLAHRVRLLGLYPGPRSTEQRPVQQYVAFLRVADAAANPIADRDAALAAATHYVSTYRRAANQLCADWQQRRPASGIQEGGALCLQLGKASRTAHAFNEDDSSWRFFFLVDDPQMRTQQNESLYLLVAIPKPPRHAFDQVQDWNVVLLPCDVTLLNEVRGGCSAPPR